MEGDTATAGPQCPARMGLDYWWLVLHRTTSFFFKDSILLHMIFFLFSSCGLLNVPTVSSGCASWANPTTEKKCFKQLQKSGRAACAWWGFGVSLERCGGRPRAVEVHAEPLGVAAVPHACLLRLAGARAALAVHVLRQADVGDAGGVLADQVHVGVEDGGVHGLAVLT